MKRAVLFITCMLAALTMSAQERLAVGDVQKSSCLSETRGEEVEPMDFLYGEWLLMGWNDGGTWFEVDKKKVSHHCMSIEFKDNGHVIAYSMVNDIFFGPLTLNGNEMHFDGDGPWGTMVYWDEMENIFFEEHIIGIKSYQLDGKRLRLYYTDNDYFVFTKDLDDASSQDDYIPFVELDKKWNVACTDANPNYVSRLNKYWMYKEEEHNGKTYTKTCLNDDILCTSEEAGLFREENRRVYKYDEITGTETMLYDFSLKEGDIFIYEGFNPSVKCKVLKQGWLEDGPKIALPITNPSDTLDFNYRRLRTWTIGAENGTGEYDELITWVEGVGTLENMFDPFFTEWRARLAYIERKDTGTDYNVNIYLPFSFYNIQDAYHHIHGCNLPTGEAGNSEYDGHHHLIYELEGDRLHVYGKVYTQCGPNNYAYFYEKQTDDPLVHKIEFEIQDVEPFTWCGGLHTTNFYVPGFDPNMNYIVIDNQGEEHPVINNTPQMVYRPFVEEGKVWKVGDITSGSPVQWVEYFYFDGDTIIGGKTCKQMMCQRYVNPDYAESNNISQDHSLSYVGAWYEEDKKVYFSNAKSEQLTLMYDFSVDANDTIEINNMSYVIGPKQTGGKEGFKGVYRNVRLWEDGVSYYSIPWLEGVGGTDRPTTSVYPGVVDPRWFLMSCTVGDEVIYFVGAEDGATPEGARKRFDFTHTVKTKPQARTRSEEGLSLYGEYNDVQLGINLDPLDDAYQVRITDETGKAVYEKAVNAGNIVGLNIDISSYAKGRYTVTVENSNDSFTGEFDAQATGIAEVRSITKEASGPIYNLQGQRLSTLQKGLNIVNGQKVYVK
jgi:hypothetical protein